MWRRFSVALFLAALSAEPPATRDLFPPTATCRPSSKELQVGNTKYQVFPDPRSGVERFRIPVSWRNSGEWLGPWKYGIANCGDFNRDGQLDYSWYGGDDTSQAHYLILSKNAGYRIIDIEKTFEAEWRRKRGGKAPDLGLLHNSFLRTITLRGAPDKLVLIATDERIRMEVEDQHWVNLR